MLENCLFFKKTFTRNGLFKGGKICFSGYGFILREVAAGIHF